MTYSSLVLDSFIVVILWPPYGFQHEAVSSGIYASLLAQATASFFCLRFCIVGALSAQEPHCLFVRVFVIVAHFSCLQKFQHFA